MIKYLLIILLAVSTYCNAEANPFSIEQGAVAGKTLQICAVKSDKTWSNDEFSRLFPKWHSLLKSKWESGEIEQVYFMKRMQDGIVFLVNGKDSADANAKAQKMGEEILKIVDAEGFSRKGSCKVFQLASQWLR